MSVDMFRVVFFAVAFSCVCLTCAASSVNDEGNYFVGRNDSVKLVLIYESYCPYSRRFYVDQLIPTWQQFKERVKLDLVPFGLAIKNYNNDDPANLKFEGFYCLHGPKECVADTLHACAIHVACGEHHGTLECHDQEKNLPKAVNYIGCIFGQKDQRQESDRCANEAGLDPTAINQCASGPLGERLGIAYSNRRWNGRRIPSVPFIVINDQHTRAEQEEAKNDLKKVICKYIPDQCQ